jgi:NAD(P)-dependent dehydrogenase (short-subunit alcohol dehydrogenase family)
MRLRSRSVLVTGATRGIGHAIALAYDLEGAGVALTYASSEEKPNPVAADITTTAARRSHCASTLEIARDSVEAAVSTAAERFGGLDVVVANAVRWPIEAAGPLHKVASDTWEEAVRVNLEGTASMCAPRCRTLLNPTLAAP